MSSVSDPPSTETKRSLPSRNQLPDEIWGLWDTENNAFVDAYEDAGDPKLMFFSAEDAKRSAEWHCTVAKLKVRPVLIYRKPQVW